MPLVRFAARLAAGILIAPAALGAGPDPAAALAAALPTVVRVDVVKRAPAAPAKSDFMEQIDRLLERPDRRTPDPRSESGSGFVLDPAAGLVVAADFVVRDAETISLLRHDGGVVVAELVAMDEETQLALLRAPLADLPAVAWADSGLLRPGDAVFAAGHLFELGLLVTGGIHSGTIGPGDGTSGRVYLATDAPVMMGSAGGPLLDAAGRVVGVLVGSFGTSLERSIGIAVPAAVARPVLERLRSGPTPRGGLD